MFNRATLRPSSLGLSLLALLAAGGLSLLALPAYAQTTIPGGNIANQTWTVAGSPYILQGDITIPAGAFLRVQAGVDIQPAANSDASGSGMNTTRVEIIALGELTRCAALIARLTS